MKTGLRIVLFDEESVVEDVVVVHSAEDLCEGGTAEEIEAREGALWYVFDVEGDRSGIIMPGRMASAETLTEELDLLRLFEDVSLLVGYSLLMGLWRSDSSTRKVKEGERLRLNMRDVRSGWTSFMRKSSSVLLVSSVRVRVDRQKGSWLALWSSRRRRLRSRLTYQTTR